LRKKKKLLKKTRKNSDGGDNLDGEIDDIFGNEPVENDNNGMD
jgi:hypothetical protein